MYPSNQYHEAPQHQGIGINQQGIKGGRVEHQIAFCRHDDKWTVL